MFLQITLFPLSYGPEDLTNKDYLSMAIDLAAQKSADPFGVFGVLEQLLVSPSLTLPPGHSKSEKLLPEGGGTKLQGPPGRHRALQDHLPEAAGTLYIRYRYFQMAPRRSKMPKTTPWTPPRAAQDAKMEPRSTQKPLIFFDFSMSSAN